MTEPSVIGGAGRLIPLGIAECCREWVVPIGYRAGRCGLCGERPDFGRVLPEEEWLGAAPTED